MLRAVDRSVLMVVAAMVVIAAACRDAMTPRPEHSKIVPAWSGTDTLVVSTSTTGSDLPAGYTVITDGGEQSQPIGTNDTVVFPDLAAGDHTVELSGVPSTRSTRGGLTAGHGATAPAVSKVTFEVCVVSSVRTSVAVSTTSSRRPTSVASGT